jgi:hypothetical protein
MQTKAAELDALREIGVSRPNFPQDDRNVPRLREPFFLNFGTTVLAAWMRLAMCSKGFYKLVCDDPNLGTSKCRPPRNFSAERKV